MNTVILLLSFACATARPPSGEGVGPKTDFLEELGGELESDSAALPNAFRAPGARGGEWPELAETGSLAWGPASLAEPLATYNPPVLPCACGCGIFEVGGSTMLPHGQGGMLWFEMDHMNQNHNWSGWKRAPDANNGDKDLRTWFYRPGGQYMFNDSWGIEAEVPFAHRDWVTDTNFPTPPENLTPAVWNALGDVRVRGLYTGFFPDLSLGVDFGVKLPTGKWNEQPDLIDRDTQISSGSTDLLLGGYYRCGITPDGVWKAYFQVESDLTVRSRDQYHPGDELDGSAGVSYNGLEVAGVYIVPLAQMLISLRSSDRGANSAQPPASGYERLLLSPGIEFAFHSFMIYGDAEFPVAQHFRGNQLVASPLYKLVIGFNF